MANGEWRIGWRQLILPFAICHLRHLLRRQHEESGDEDRFRRLAVLALKDLEGLSRLLGKSVEIEAIVPVGVTDEGQAVGPAPVERVLQGALEMLIQRRLRAGLIVVGYGRVEDVPVARLLDVSRHRQHQPQRIVVEAAANRVIAPLGERLVLVIGAAVGQLGRGDVENALSGSLGYHVDKA